MIINVRSRIWKYVNQYKLSLKKYGFTSWVYQVTVWEYKLYFCWVFSLFLKDCLKWRCFKKLWSILYSLNYISGSLFLYFWMAPLVWIWYLIVEFMYLDSNFYEFIQKFISRSYLQETIEIQRLKSGTKFKENPQRCTQSWRKLM